MADNWYEEQRKAESKISAWDLDNRRDSAYNVRNEHEEHCDVEETSQYHKYEEHSKGYGTGEVVDQDKPKSSLFFSIAFINVFIGFAMAVNNIIAWKYAIIFFLLVNPGIFIVGALYRGNMQKATGSIYWLLVVIFELYVVINRFSDGYLRYLLIRLFR